ncbi:hypothetical protein CDD83_5164 [Cordyceps sp. RAO-2017]|nr:hypothetical protein CDD83_5164 [Cordyceps sp. RAO-2017]
MPPLVDEARANQTAFAGWWNGRVLPAGADACSERLVVYKSREAGAPAYRHQSHPLGTGGRVGVLLGFITGFAAPLAGFPEVVVPVGEAAYRSAVTGRDEFLPVTVRIMAARGCDAMLLDLVRDLVREGILPTVRAGSRLGGGSVRL